MKLNIHFGEEKAKPIFFASKRRSKNFCQLNVTYSHINIKQHSQVTYLECLLDERMSCEPIALKVINKINGKLKLLYRKNFFISQKSVTESSAMLLFSQTLIMHVQHGILISKKKRKRKYK